MKNIIVGWLLVSLHFSVYAKDAGGLKLIRLAYHEHPETIFQCAKVEHKLEALQILVREAWDGTSSTDYSQCKFFRNIKSVYLSARNRGKRLKHRWSSEPKNVQSLVKYIAKFKKSLANKKATTLELHLSHRYSDVNYKDRNKRRNFESNVNRGIHGIEVKKDGKIIARYAATHSIVQNKKHRVILDELLTKYNVSRDDIGANVSLSTFNSDQYFFEIKRDFNAYKMFRGNKIVNVTEVSKESIQKWVDFSSEWLINNLHPTGRMTYQFFPSEHSETGRRQRASNNMIRQWMATIALDRIAARTLDPYLENRIETNIDYNLSQFYHVEGSYGIIEYGQMVKLGALALSALAIVESPNRKKWQHQEMALRKTIQSLWNENGEFDTFYKPRDRKKAYNFYPGETLLLWSTLYVQDRDPQLLKQIMQSFQFYRNWHLRPDKRNPAFIPWHTQAYYNIWEITKNDELKDFIFVMNDWLIKAMLQWRKQVSFDDLLGRFYSRSPNYGPPHASSTGVYLEGLIDAFRLARQVGDKEREENYRVAIIRGLRSLMQLQYTDEMDMFYIPKKYRNYVFGGLRTTVYDNLVRCDNIQHALMGVLRVIEHFNPDDYRHPKEAEKPQITLVEVDANGNPVNQSDKKTPASEAKAKPDKTNQATKQENKEQNKK